MNTTVISGRLVRNPGYNEVENEKGLHKIAKFVLAVRRNYSDEVSFIPVKAFAKKAEFARDFRAGCEAVSAGLCGDPPAQ